MGRKHAMLGNTFSRLEKIRIPPALCCISINLCFYLPYQIFFVFVKIFLLRLTKYYSLVRGQYEGPPRHRPHPRRGHCLRRQEAGQTAARQAAEAQG